MLRLIIQLRAVVAEATRLAQLAKNDDSGWIVFFEARSFWLSVIGVILTAFTVFGFGIPFDHALITEITLGVVSLVPFAWALIERLRGKKQVVWTVKQANDAIKQAELLYENFKKLKGNK